MPGCPGAGFRQGGLGTRCPWLLPRAAGRAGVALLVLTVVAVTVVLVVPGARAGAKAPALMAEALGVDVPRPLAADVVRSEEMLDGVVGDLYDAGAGAPPVLLLPGAAPAGREDTRVVQLAEALGRSHRTVFVPQLSLFDGALDVDDLDRVVRSVVALSARSGDRPVVLLGISFGGSLALVAAADERATPVVRLVATFGSYADLVGLLQAATTGVSVVGERRLPWEVPAAAAEALPEVALGLVPASQRAALSAALAGGDASALPEEAAAVHALLTNDDPDRTFVLGQRLGPTARAVVAAYSPAAVADGLADVPVLAAHSRDDPAVPYAELLRLERVLPHSRTVTVDSFDHVDLDAGGDPVGLVRDLVTAWSFLRGVLAAQEGWPGQGF